MVVDDGEFLTTAEVADRLRLSPPTIRMLIRTGAVTAVNPDRIWLITTAELDRYIEQSRIPKPRALARDASPSRPQDAPQYAAGTVSPMNEICIACGQTIVLSDDPSEPNPTSMREPNGRATYEQGGLIRHQCTDGAFVDANEIHPNIQM